MKWNDKNFGFVLLIVLLIASIVTNLFLLEKMATDNIVVADEKTDTVEEIKLLVRTNDVHYMYGEATAYTPSMGGINSDCDPLVTSTMAPAVEGVIAVNPEVIPYGSEVMIISGNTVVRGTALDTGGAMKRNPHQVDILMENHQDAIEWGRREVHIIWW